MLIQQLQQVLREGMSWGSSPKLLTRCSDAAHSSLGSTRVLHQRALEAWSGTCISTKPVCSASGNHAAGAQVSTSLSQLWAMFRRTSSAVRTWRTGHHSQTCSMASSCQQIRTSSSNSSSIRQALQQQQALWWCSPQQGSHRAWWPAPGTSWCSASRRSFAASAQRKEKASAADLGLYAGAAVIAVIGFSYAMVPLYRVFCVATGYGGALAGSDTVEEKLQRRLNNPNPELEKVAAQREITVWFNADVADDMPWQFKPAQECVKIKAGQSALAFFNAQNTSDKPVTGYSLYNVTPDRAAQYFNKIQCFCFEEQRLRAGETIDMPVFFYIDPEMAADWNCRNINDITLSYVFHKVDDADLEGQDDDDELPSGLRLHGSGLEALPEGIAPPVVPASASPSAATVYQQQAATADTAAAIVLPATPAPAPLAARA